MFGYSKIKITAVIHGFPVRVETKVPREDSVRWVQLFLELVKAQGLKQLKPASGYALTREPGQKD